MADKKKSILDEALLDAKRIQEALNANSKEILASLTKEEIDSIVKESLEEDYLEEDVVTEDELETGEEEAGEELEADEESEAGEELEADEESEEDEIEGDEVGASMDSIEGDDLEGDYESGMDALASDDEDEIDMTTASDDDVIAVYKKLTGDDEIEVVVDDEAGEVHLSVNEPGEFVIKTGEGAVEGGEEELEIEPMGDMDDEAGEIEDEVMYEIALDEMEDIEGKKAPIASGDNFGGSTTDEDGEKGFKEKPTHANAEGDMVMSEEDESLEESEELTEEDEADGEEAIDEKIAVGKGMSVGGHRNPKGPGSIGAPEGAGAKVNESEVIKKYNTLLTEAKELKGRNNEYKQALKQFRTMLAETVVFNSNLTYVTKLFMEHSTTKDEKENIFKRFDNEVSTLKESKKLYKTIESELKNRKPLNESIENKIMKDVSTSKSTQLNESTAYVDKETSRIMDLMRRVNNR